MTVIPLDSKHRDRYQTRILALRENTPAQFGRLDATQMLAHLRFALETCLGDHELEDQSTWLSRRGWFCVFVFRWLPWPKGKIKAPAAMTPRAEYGFEEERRRLLESVDRFIAEAEAQPERIGQSPVFKGQPLRRWRMMQGRHMNHHLEQFNV